MKWFRFYSEALDDPKVQRLPGELFKSWVNLLCLANDGTPRGTLPSIEDIGFRLRLTPAKTVSTLNQLKKLGLLDDDTVLGLIPHGWETRQSKSDNVAARVQKHRSKQENEGECNVTPPVTQPVTRNVTVTPQKKTRVDTDTDTEKEGEKKSDSALPRVIVSDTPFSVYSTFLDETAEPDFTPSPAWKGKQIGIATRLIEQGYGDDKVRRCVRFMRSQTWRTSPFDLGGVEGYIGTWEAAGMPEHDQPKRGSPKQPDNQRFEQNYNRHLAVAQRKAGLQ